MWYVPAWLVQCIVFYKHVLTRNHRLELKQRSSVVLKQYTPSWARTETISVWGGVLEYIMKISLKMCSSTASILFVQSFWLLCSVRNFQIIDDWKMSYGQITRFTYEIYFSGISYFVTAPLVPTQTEYGNNQVSPLGAIIDLDILCKCPLCQPFFHYITKIFIFLTLSFQYWEQYYIETK